MQHGNFLPAVRAGDLELRVADGGMRWKIQPYAQVEVWSGMILVGTLSGAALCLIVEHYLATAALQATMSAQISLPLPSWAPVIRDPSPLVLPRKPMRPSPAKIDKAALRTRRRSRRTSR